MTKYFVLRPHALLSSYDSTQHFGEDNVVIVPLAVIDEVSAMQDLSQEKRKVKRHVLKYIRSLLDKGVLEPNGYKQENGSILKVVTNYKNCNIGANVANITKFQKRTLQVCKGLQEELKGKDAKVILITNNFSLQIKSHMIGIESELFKDEIFPVLEQQYSGRLEIPVCKEVIDEMYSEGSVEINSIFENEKYEWVENCNVMLKCGSSTAYGIVKDSKIIKKNAFSKNPYGLKAMNDGQRLLVNALSDDTPLNIVKGAAGTGKTIVSLAIALQRHDEEKCKKILITRKVTNDVLGYLPGDVDEKMTPFLKGIKDNLKQLINSPTIDCSTEKKDSGEPVENGDYFFEQGIIEIETLEAIRGRSIINTIFIIDEAQNIDPEFIKSIVTRAAKGSKFIFMGDPTQIDNPKLSERFNGLVYVAEKFKGQKLANIITLYDDESVRSDLARLASEIL